MNKRFLTLLLILPILTYCAPAAPADNSGQNQEETPGNTPGDTPGEDPGNNPGEEEPDPYENAAPEVKDGDTVLATNELVEKFLTEVEYKDKDLSYTKIYDYPGGFGGPDGLNWENWETEWPDGDKPKKYSIRWSKDDLEEGAMTLHLEDKLGWSGDMEIKAGSLYVDITNLVPNDDYNYRVTAASGKTLAQGSFKTTGHLHQVFFTGKVATITQKVDGERIKITLKGDGCRNARDLGGWEAMGGKHVKYRKIYRGGRMNEKWDDARGRRPLNKQGEKEVLFEGIKAEIDLRGSDDIIYEPAVAGLDHWHGVIEEGGKCMLGVTKPSAKNCAKWLKFDQGRTDITDVSSYTPTDQEYADFQEAYKAKTKDLFDFVRNCVKDNKPVYFHCSLGRDRTGTLDVILLGILGVPEHIISKEYEVSYFAPVGYSVSSSDVASNPEPIFKNTRMHWVYSDIVPYFWELAGSGTFADGVEKYLTEIAGVSKADIDDFRKLMLE